MSNEVIPGKEVESLQTFEGFAVTRLFERVDGNGDVSHHFSLKIQREDGAFVTRSVMIKPETILEQSRIRIGQKMEVIGEKYKKKTSGGRGATRIRAHSVRVLPFKA